MEMNSLAGYVKGRIEAGLSSHAIREELLAVGWTEEESDAAYRDGLVALGIPLPSASNRPPLPQAGGVSAAPETGPVPGIFMRYCALLIRHEGPIDEALEREISPQVRPGID